MQTRWNSFVVIEQKVEKICYPYSDCWIIQADAVRIWIANALESTFCSITTIEFHLVCIVF